MGRRHHHMCMQGACRAEGPLRAASSTQVHKVSRTDTPSGAESIGVQLHPTSVAHKTRRTSWQNQPSRNMVPNVDDSGRKSVEAETGRSRTESCQSRLKVALSRRKLERFRLGAARNSPKRLNVAFFGRDRPKLAEGWSDPAWTPRMFEGRMPDKVPILVVWVRSRSGTTPPDNDLRKGIADTTSAAAGTNGLLRACARGHASGVCFRGGDPGHGPAN